jgi:hypothetical protein
MTRATSFNFFSVIILLKTTCLEEKIHHEVKKVEEGREKKPESKNLFDLFDLVVKISSKTWLFLRT